MRPIKIIILNILEFYLDNKLIYILDSDSLFKNSLFKKIEITKIDLFNLINTNWHKNADFEDLYFLPWFKFNNWYINTLKEKGLKHSTNWQKFVTEEIGDLEKWIRENKSRFKKCF